MLVYYNKKCFVKQAYNIVTCQTMCDLPRKTACPRMFFYDLGPCVSRNMCYKNTIHHPIFEL